LPDLIGIASRTTERWAALVGGRWIDYLLTTSPD
jgi:hypothetical protein